jgi:predicted transcriptional regulator
MSGMTSEQIRAGRMLIRWEQKDLAEASKVSLPTIKRLETQPGIIQANETTIAAIEAAFSKAGIELIAENGGGAGVRLAKRKGKR